MVGIDCTYWNVNDCVQGELKLGIDILAAEILDAFSSLNIQNHFCLIVRDEQAAFARKRFPDYAQCIIHFRFFEDCSRIVSRITCGKKTLLRLRQYMFNIIVPKTTNSYGFSCIWHPFTIPSTNWDSSIPTLATIHDIMPCRWANTEEASHRYEEMVRRCDKIVTISEYVKKDILETFPNTHSEIIVIPNSITLDISDVEKVGQIQKPYILDINGYGPHKNTMTLLEAYAKLADRIDMDLVCCGSWKNTEYWDALNAFIAEHGLSERVHLLYAIPKEQRNWLLKNASLFVTPSTEEGFGRTPVEAAICGVPVISTKATSLYEVTMGLAHYYEEPENAEELAQTILKCILHPDTEEKLAEISAILTRTYSKETCAMMYWEILRRFDGIEQGGV